MTIRLFYDRWPQYERRLVESIRDLTPEQLELRAAPEHWPVWAIASHVAGTRVYWLCHILGEPGAETTPFADPDADGWEDDLDRPAQRGRGRRCARCDVRDHRLGPRPLDS